MFSLEVKPKNEVRQKKAPGDALTFLDSLEENKADNDNHYTLDELVEYAKQIFSQENDNKNDKSILKLFFEKFNDPNLFWPYGKRLINVPDIELPKVKVRDVVLALAIVFNFNNVAEAKQLGGVRVVEKNIEWALKVLEKMDGIEYLVNLKVPNEERKDDEAFSEEEINMLSWNIYHEARGEKSDGAKLAVLLASLERMRSADFPKSAIAVVLQSYQYSWTIGGNKHPLPNSPEQAIDIRAFEAIQKLVKERINDKSKISEVIKNLKNELVTMVPGNKGFEGIVSMDYHSYDTITNEFYRSQIKSPDTYLRVEVVNKILQKGGQGKVFLFGSHVFHTREFTKTNYNLDLLRDANLFSDDEREKILKILNELEGNRKTNAKRIFK